MLSTKSYYEILNISPKCDFKELKKAYYKHAKKCHPDRHGGSLEKEAEFKKLVHIFDILSDPVKRSQYDLSIGVESENGYKFSAKTFSIMDSPSDDTLEEIIVGNTIPENATIATLFTDLEKSEVFIAFREGKTLYYDRKIGLAMNFFKKTVEHTPHNILYRFYLARTFVAAGLYRKAVKQYKHAIAIGATRIPPQRLERIHSELRTVQKKRNPWWYTMLTLFTQPDRKNQLIETEEQMIDEANRSIAKIMAKKEQKQLTQNQ